MAEEKNDEAIKDEKASDQNVRVSFVEDDTSLTTVKSMSRSTVHSFCFMDKRAIYRVYDDFGVDVTPDNIVDGNYVTMEHSFSHAAFESKPRYEILLKSRSQVDEDMGMRVFTTTIDLDSICIDHTIDTDEGYPPEGGSLDKAPSAYYLPKEMPLTKYPAEILIVLKETETIYLFEQPTYSFEKGTPEAVAAEEENEYYQFITVGKGRNRKMVNQETQTSLKIFQTRHSLSIRPKKKNASTFASVWDMLDTYEQLAQDTGKEEEDDEMVMFPSVPLYMLRKKRLKKVVKEINTTWEQISKLHQFFDAAVLCQHVLAAKDYAEAQKTFRGLDSVNLLSPDLVYIYTMKPLWTLECPETANKPISTITFNPKNPDILAIGHGKFGYAEKHKGIVAVWSTKNPCAPERLYNFESPVTSLAFSTQTPNWLVVAFSNGDLCLLDITSYRIKMIAKSKRDTNPSFQPIWSTLWANTEAGTEYVMTAGQDGRINKFTSTKTHDFICTPMMRIASVEGKLKGLETPKTCMKQDVPIIRNPAALCVRVHPTIGHVYLVGSDEGCVHRCSTHYLNQHIDVYKMHAGPIYSMIFSPFMPELLVTCGADFAIRLWMEDMDDVIMTLNCQAAVYDIAFCPINSTILISASGNVISIWDLRRKTHIPCAEYSFASNVLLTYVKFSPSGDNLFVGDTAGRVYTFHLEDTPIPPYYQLQMLDEAIKKALCTRPELLKQLEKIQNIKNKHSKKAKGK